MINFNFKASMPANIAWIKYWGKKNHQLPLNPSISMTLTQSKTNLSVQIQPNQFDVKVKFNDKINEAFSLKFKKYIDSLDFPFLKNYSYQFDSENTFPHSSGIASSASSFAALSKILSQFIFQETQDEKYLQVENMSSLARLGSGSAARSFYNGFSLWGKTELLDSSHDEYAVSVDNIHSAFSHIHDVILIISSEPKNVSSSFGHDLMKDHPYLLARHKQVSHHLTELLSAFKNGDWMKAGGVIEKEALTLHALMMTSNPGFILFKPNSLIAMEKIRKFREKNHCPVFYTLDAGANVHVIFPHEIFPKVKHFIISELSSLTEKGDALIWDHT